MQFDGHTLVCVFSPSVLSTFMWALKPDRRRSVRGVRVWRGVLWDTLQTLLLNPSGLMLECLVRPPELLITSLEISLY